MQMFLLVFLLVMGLVWGSFLNVVIYRVANGTSPLSGRSKCPKCGKTIPWKYNIPLLSFFWLRGKCAFCHTKISWRYPVVELLTGLLFVWWYWVGGGFFNLVGRPWNVVQPLFWLLVGMLLMTVFFSDVFYGVISDGINLMLFTLAFFYRVGLVVAGQMRVFDLATALLSGFGVMVFFWCLWWFTNKKGFGEGDIKLAPAIGLLMGWPKTLVGIFFAFASGAVVALLLIILGKKRFGQTIPFGPFLVFGVVFALVKGMAVWSWYWGLLE